MERRRAVEVAAEIISGILDEETSTGEVECWDAFIAVKQVDSSVMPYVGYMIGLKNIAELGGTPYIGLDTIMWDRMRPESIKHQVMTMLSALREFQRNALKGTN